MRDFLTKDIGWKIFSLGLAISLYFTVRTVRQSSGSPSRPLEARVEHTYRGIPVLVVSSAADVREFKVNPAIVQITVRGRPEALSQLQEEELRVTVDLTGIESTAGLTKRVNVSMPPGITLVEVIPAEVSVVIPSKKEPAK